MAMTKKEQAEMEQLRKDLRLARALRFTEPVKPDVPPPSNSGELTKGWIPLGTYESMRAAPACSSSVGHGWDTQEKTHSHGSRSLYSTKLLALKAGRNEIERQCAMALARIDEDIEIEAAVWFPE